MHTIELLINLGIAIATNAHAVKLLVSEIAKVFHKIRSKKRGQNKTNS